MNKIVRPKDATPIWGRSAAAMAAVLLAFREIEPEAPWWASLILAGVVLVLAQLAAPSKRAGS